MNTAVLTNVSELTSLIAEWNSLQERTGTHIFQRPAFLLSWWDTLGSGELWCITVRSEDGVLRGLAPCMKTTTENGDTVISFIGCVAVSDYLDVLVDPSYETEVYQEFATRLQGDIQWNRLYLCSLPETSSTRTWLMKQYPHALQTQQDVCPLIKLPQDWESYLASLGRKERHELRRKVRNSEQHGIEYTVYTSEVDVKRALPMFVKLHELSSKEKQSFWTDEHRAFFDTALPALARDGRVRLFFMHVEKKAVATMLVFTDDMGYYLYNSGFDPEYRQLSVGTVLTAYTIKDALLQGKKVYDFLRGSEEYKFRFGAVAQPVYDYDIIRT